MSMEVAVVLFMECVWHLEDLNRHQYPRLLQIGLVIPSIDLVNDDIHDSVLNDEGLTMVMTMLSNPSSSRLFVYQFLPLV